MSHDSLYKRFFSCPATVQDLLQGFVPGEWVHHLDYSTLTRISNTFTTEQLKQRHADVIWKVLHNNGQPIYLYVMIEFQSTPDPFMALRCAVYACLLLQELVQQEKLKAGQLPPVFPVVIYNGDTAWNEATSLKDLMVNVPGLEPFQPQMALFLIDEKRVPEEQLSLQNLLACMVKLEQTAYPDQLFDLFGKLAERYQSDTSAEAQLMLEVFWHAALKIANAKHYETAPLPSSWKEVNVTMSGYLKEWYEAQFKQAALQGEAKGEAKGKAEGEISLLKKQLKLKFGSLPEGVEARLATLSLEQLERVAERILFVNQLDDLFSEG